MVEDIAKWPEPKGYFSLFDMAFIHQTSEQEVLRVLVDVLGIQPKDKYDLSDLLRVNRILSPVPEPNDIVNWQ